MDVDGASAASVTRSMKKHHKEFWDLADMAGDQQGGMQADKEDKGLPRRNYWAHGWLIWHRTTTADTDWL